MSDSAEKTPHFQPSDLTLESEPTASSAAVASLVPDSSITPKRRLSVVLKLTMLVGLTLTFLLAVLLTGSWFYWRAVVRKLVETHLSGAAATRRDMVQAQVSQLLQRIELSTDRGEFRGLLPESAHGVTTEKNRAGSELSLQRISNGKPIIAAALADNTGHIVLSTDPAEVGRSVVTDAEFLAGLNGANIGFPRQAHDRFVATLAAPVRSRTEPGRVYGVLLATADVSEMARTVGDTTGLGKSGEAILGVREGARMRFLFPPRNAPQTALVPLATAPDLKAETAGAETFLRCEDYRGVPVLTAGRPIGYGGWALVVKMDEREAYAPIAVVLRLGVIFGLLVATVGLAAAYALARSFTRPVLRLAQAASRVAGGDYDSQVPVKSGDELGALSADFNAMTAAIRARGAERDKAERALRASEERARQIAESLPQLVFTCRPDGTCDYLSPQWVEYTGIPAESQLDFGWLDQVHPDDRQQLKAQWQVVAGVGGALDVQFRIRRHDGVYRWFRTRASPLKDENGRVVKWFGTNTDIDDTHCAEEALRDADQRKDEFIAMLGHELRNPLSAISNAALMWKESDGDSNAASDARGIIERQTENLRLLVDDLLDVARISEGKIELRKRPVDVGKVVGWAVEAVRPLIEERRHELDLSLAGGGQLRVNADPTRLEQIVTNLLTNAAKYTPDGGKIIVVERREGRDAVITVSDNGVGFSSEMLPKIFELFTQADRSLDRTAGGLGIGLNLCRQLVELHGGTIAAHSNGPGLGAVFTLRFPAVEEPEPVELQPTAAIVPTTIHRRILLVDDNEDTVRSLVRLHTRRGHEVAAAYDGLAALTMAHEFKPDILLLDIGLPGLDGYALARRLRSEGFVHTPMIAISGYAQEGDRARAHEAGFDRHFAKPVDFEALAALLAERPAPPPAMD